MDRYLGSGYAAAQDIIDRWSLRLADEPDFEERFMAWCAVKGEAWKEQRIREVRAYATNVENVGRGNSVVLRARNRPADPHAAGGGEGSPRAEHLNTLLEAPGADVPRMQEGTQPRAGGDPAWAAWRGTSAGGNLPPAAIDAPDETGREEHPPRAGADASATPAPPPMAGGDAGGTWGGDGGCEVLSHIC
eukprot:1737767-Alexandrium_andersonii.AAC.1